MSWGQAEGTQVCNSKDNLLEASCWAKHQIIWLELVCPAALVSVGFHWMFYHCLTRYQEILNISACSASVLVALILSVPILHCQQTFPLHYSLSFPDHLVNNKSPSIDSDDNSVVTSALSFKN